MDLQNLRVLKTLFTVYLKDLSFWPSADAKPMQKDQLHAMPWQCMFSLYSFSTISMIEAGTDTSLYMVGERQGARAHIIFSLYIYGREF
jgi:hypothetical protein